MRTALSILCYLRKIALCFWLGEMLFFIVIFAPQVFKILPKPVAAELQGAIFPAYYAAGLVCGAVVLVSLLATQAFGVLSVNADSRGIGGELFTDPGAGCRRASVRRFPALVGITLFALLIFAVSLWWFTPEIASLRPLLYGANVDANAHDRFQFLHQISVQANGAALLALLALLFLI